MEFLLTILLVASLGGCAKTSTGTGADIDGPPGDAVNDGADLSPVDGDDPGDTGSDDPGDTGGDNGGDPDMGGDDSGDTGSDDPGDTGGDNGGDPDMGGDDPGDTGSDDPGDTGSDDPGDTGSDDPGDTGSDTPEEMAEPEQEPEQEREREPEADPIDYETAEYAWLADVSCATPPPEGATLARAPKPYSGGTCPALASGANTLASGGAARRFVLIAPADIQPEERFPVLFLWHWLKGRAQSFIDKGQIESAVAQQRFIAVVPETKGDLSLFGVMDIPWPFTTFQSAARMEEEFTFFDDMLACVSEQLPVNKECVSSVGVSAGAMFTNQLAHARSEWLSSFLSLSGGVKGASIVNTFMLPWHTANHRLPAVVLWGGSGDTCALLNFEEGSRDLMTALEDDGHFFIECIHNCRHGEPPVEPPEGVSRYSPLWDFAFKHPYWLPAGLSPYLVTGWPTDVIPWCGIGKGSARIRSGACGEPGCPVR